MIFQKYLANYVEYKWSRVAHFQFTNLGAVLTVLEANGLNTSYVIGLHQLHHISYEF